MEIILQFLFAFFATLSFAIYFNAPIKSIIACGLIGALSWVLYYSIFITFNNKTLGVLLASFLVGILSELAAINLKKPATVFITAGIIAMVPGAGMYYTMYNLVGNNFFEAAKFGTETFFIAAAIAFGIIISTVFLQSLKGFKKN